MKYKRDRTTLNEQETYLYAACIAYQRLLEIRNYKRLPIHWTTVLQKIQETIPEYTDSPLLVDSIIDAFWEAYYYLNS